jgi:PAS domain S-box-containing protein
MSASSSPPSFSADTGLLQSLLDVSLAALCLLRPCPQPSTEEVVDFTLEYLNPEGQRLLGLPEQPGQALRTLLPLTHETDVLAFCRNAFAADAACQLDVRYPATAPDSYLRLAARRHGEYLLVSFTGVADRPRPAHVAPRTRLAHPPKTAPTDAEQYALLQAVLAQAPVGITFYQGDDLVIAMANEQICAMWGHPPAEVLGRPLFEAMPTLRGQGFEQLLAEVMRTGVPFVGTEAAAQLPRAGGLATHYFNFVYQPMLGPDGKALGVVNLAIDVTDQVRARQQLQQLNHDLAARVAERTQAALAAQAEAEVQRQRLERLFMAAPVAIAIFGGPELVHELANPLYQEMVPGRAVLGQPLLAVVPELADTEIYAHLRRVYDTGIIHYQPNHRLLSTPTGAAARYFNITYKPRRNEHEHVDGVLLFAFEITEQVVAQQRADALQAEVLATAQQQVQERETLYQVFEQTPARIALLRGPEHRFMYSNGSYRQLFTSHEVVGRTVAEVMPEAAKLGFVRLLDGVYQTGKTYFGNEMPYTFIKPGDTLATTAYFNFTYQAYRENGETVGVSVFSYDVTEQVQARLQRESQQQQLRELFVAAPLSICLFGGPDFVYELASRQHEALFPDRQLLGRPLLEAVPELAGQPVWHVLQRVYQTGETEVDLNILVPLARRLGEPLEDTYFDYIFQARHDEQGAINGVLVFAFEVTEQTLGRQQVQSLNQELQGANQELQAANQQLTRANTDLANFIYTASHDLKTPISNIEGLLNMLYEELPADVLDGAIVPSVLEMMKKAVERFQLTITHLTDITRLQQAHTQATATVDLATLVEEVCLDLAPLLASQPTELVVDVAANLTVHFSPKNLRSIVYNLLSNAIKYGHPDRAARVQLRAYRAASAAATILEVQDNGLGLRPDQQARLFGLFKRLHDHVEGSGVGLYMIKKIVENAGGTITVTSEPGSGSTFTVLLPD